MQPLLVSLCEGLRPEDLPAAMAGLLAEAPHVRGAAIAALAHIPFLSNGAIGAANGATGAAKRVEEPHV